MSRYTKNFTIAEFASQDGKEKDARMCPEFMHRLQNLRDKFDFPMIITSGIRSQSHNRAVGGARLSMHLTTPCQACDIAIIDWSGSKKHRFLRLALSNGFKGIGISKNFIHLDMRSATSLWTY